MLHTVLLQKRFTSYRNLLWILWLSLSVAHAELFSVSRLGSGAGSVLSDDENLQCSDARGRCGYDYISGTPIILTATAGPHSRFLSWGGGFCTGVQATCAKTTDAEVRTVAAHFSGASLAAGQYYSLALTAKGAVWAFGENSLGQLGAGDKLPHKALGPVKGSDGNALQGIKLISAGTQHALSLTESGTVLAWGNNDKGQIGDTTREARATAVGASTVGGISLIAAGKAYSVALTDTGTVWTWGENTFGQLGNGTKIDQATPKSLENFEGLVAIATGENHAVGLKNDGTVWAWGKNQAGQLGDGASTHRDVPTPVKFKEKRDQNIVAIAAGGDHTLALKGDGTVLAWGSNSTGELGDVSRSSRLTPVSVMNIQLEDGVKIAAGNRHSVLLKRDGTVWAWGNNASGQLGDGTRTVQTKPVRVRFEEGALIVDIAAGGDHTLALQDNGRVWGFGGNAHGQLGGGTTLDALFLFKWPT